MAKFGSLLDLGDIRNYRYDSYPYKSTDPLPDKFKVDHSVLAIKDQKDYNACVGFACSYLLEIFNNLEIGSQEKMSPFYIYGKHRDYQDEGMYLGKTLKYLMSEGTLPEVDFPYEGEMPNIRQNVLDYMKLHPELEEKLKKNVISGYVDLVDKSTDENIKRCLVDYNYPVIAVTTHFGGYHCVLIDGYNDTNKDFTVPNSWGLENGVSGYDTIDYGSIVEAYLVIDSTSIVLPFTDVSEDDPCYKEIKNLFFSGVMIGRSADKFCPDEPMTRREYALATYRNNKLIQEKIDKIYNLIKEMKN